MDFQLSLPFLRKCHKSRNVICYSTNLSVPNTVELAPTELISAGLAQCLRLWRTTMQPRTRPYSSIVLSIVYVVRDEVAIHAVFAISFCAMTVQILWSLASSARSRKGRICI